MPLDKHTSRPQQPDGHVIFFLKSDAIWKSNAIWHWVSVFIIMRGFFSACALFLRDEASLEYIKHQKANGIVGNHLVLVLVLVFSVAVGVGVRVAVGEIGDD